MTNWRGYGIRKITPKTGRSGYLKVCLFDENKKVHRFYIHKLVAETFLGERPEGAQIRHLNGNKTDNRVSNLAWGSAKDNAKDRDRHNTTARGERNGFSKRKESQIREILKLKKLNFSNIEIARKTSLSKDYISAVVCGKIWHHIWREFHV
jgi:hypothetical protein